MQFEQKYLAWLESLETPARRQPKIDFIQARLSSTSLKRFFVSYANISIDHGSHTD